MHICISVCIYIYIYIYIYIHTHVYRPCTVEAACGGRRAGPPCSAGAARGMLYYTMYISLSLYIYIYTHTYIYIHKGQTRFGLLAGRRHAGCSHPAASDNERPSMITIHITLRAAYVQGLTWTGSVKMSAPYLLNTT